MRRRRETRPRRYYERDRVLLENMLFSSREKEKEADETVFVMYDDDGFQKV